MNIKDRPSIFFRGTAIGSTKKEYKYRILKADRRILNAGTGLNSWFTLSQAKKIVNYDKGESIYEYDGPGGEKLWEVV